MHGPGAARESRAFRDQHGVRRAAHDAIRGDGRGGTADAGRIPPWGIYDVFDTADDSQVFVGVVTDTQWKVFCEVFGMPHLLADAALTTNRQRVGARERYMPEVRALMARMPRAEIVRLCEANGLPYAPIMRPKDMFDDPQMQEPGAMIDVTLADGRTARTPALPLEFGGERLGRRLDIPMVGEHSREIVAEIGSARDEIDDLIAQGVISVAALPRS